MSSCFAAGNLVSWSKNSSFHLPFNKLTLPLSNDALISLTLATLSFVGGLSSFTLSPVSLINVCTIDLPDAFGSTYILLLFVYPFFFTHSGINLTSSGNSFLTFTQSTICHLLSVYVYANNAEGSFF